MCCAFTSTTASRWDIATHTAIAVYPYSIIASQQRPRPLNIPSTFTILPEIDDCCTALLPSPKSHFIRNFEGKALAFRHYVVIIHPMQQIDTITTKAKGHLDSLERAQLAFLRRLVSKRADSLACTGIAAYLLRTQSLGEVRQERIRYGAEDYFHAERLIDLFTGASVVPQLTACPSDASEDGLVAVAPLGPWIPAPFPCNFMVLEWRRAAALPLYVLVVCSHLDHLHEAQRFTWLAKLLDGRPALAVYAGDSSRYHQDASTSALLRATQAPVWSLGDWNAKELFAAAGLPRLERIVLPPDHDLKRTPSTMSPASFAATRSRYARSIEAVKSPVIAAAWAKMQPLANGWRAYSAPSRAHVPRDGGHRFHLMAGSHSKRWRAPVQAIAGSVPF